MYINVFILKIGAGAFPTINVTSVLDLHFRKTAAQEELALVRNEAQRLCSATYQGIQFLWDMEVPDDMAGQGLRAIVFSKVMSLEKSYDSFHMLFRSMSLDIRPLPRRLSMIHSLEEDNFVDILSYVDSEEC